MAAAVAALMPSAATGLSAAYTFTDVSDLFLNRAAVRFKDFAFARSVPRDIQPHGLPRSRSYPEHVSQNPSCRIGDGAWFATIEEVWNLP